MLIADSGHELITESLMICMSAITLCWYCPFWL